MGNKSEGQILRDFKNCNPDMVAQAVKDNQGGSSDDSFTGKRNQQELNKFVEGALYILNKKR